MSEEEIRQVKAEAWDEGHRARGESLGRWYEAPSVERMYWPDDENPYRGGGD